MTLFEISEAAKIITASADPQAKIIFGAFRDEDLNKGMIKITVIAAGFENEGSNIITKERRSFDADADAEVESNFNKNEDDKHIPAFMRRGKSPPVDKSEPLRIKRDDRINRTFLKNYHDKFQPSRPAMAGRDFYKEGNLQKNTRPAYHENFRAKAIKVFKITFSILKNIAEVSLTIVLGTIVMVALGIYKAGSIVKNWFQRMIY